jgi:broad specificity phosphatase PhoE
MTRRLWLVRHGETEGQSSIRYHGSNDVQLSAIGQAQIRALVPWLAGVDFGAVWHSPLARAARSAELLVEGCRLPRDRMRCDDRLREICFGTCEGMTAEEIAAAFPDFWQQRRAEPDATFPGGEPRAAFRARIDAAMREITGRDGTGDILVVAHRGIVRQALRNLLKVQAEGDAFGVELASLTIVRERLGWQIEMLGARP